MPPPKPDYFRLATRHRYHGALLVAFAIGSLAGWWHGSWVPFLVLGAAELLYLFVVPNHPAFRRACDRELAGDEARARARDLERIAGKLSQVAKSRYDGIVRLRQQILDAMKTLGASEALQAQWKPKLDALVNQALRILVAVDATRADDRDKRLLESDVRQLEQEIAALPAGGAAKAAKQQRLELARQRLADFATTWDQREAAVTQLDTVEDLLKELLAQGLNGRDAAAFGQRLDRLSAQIAAAGESVAALDRHSENHDELAELKSGS
jgi:hypothetical protein